MSISDADLELMHRVCAERYAVELLWALRDAVAGASHWRPNAQALIDTIDAGALPEPPRPWR
jgi:hypothetical protein